MAIKISGTTVINDSRNIANVGIITATTFSGNLTGTASTASFATTSFGLSGTPNIVAGIITATSFVGSGANLTSLPVSYTELDGMLFS